MGNYIHTPSFVKWQDVTNNNLSLSPAQYVRLVMPNKNYLSVSQFLKRPLKRTDLGVEVGSLSYIDKSPVRFIRTKALQKHSFLPDLNSETALPILPSDFVQMNLKEGDLLISKDSNIGEIVILDKDYPNYMLSGAIYRLPVKDEWRYYLLAFIKHDIFREQLDFMVPKGATIRHAKTLFLDCKIPLPTRNVENVICYISLLTQAIINKEKLIRQHHTKIMQLIDKELYENQKVNNFEYAFPRINDIRMVGRLDVSRYSKTYKEYEQLITNYTNGSFKLSEQSYSVKRGQNLQVSCIGDSIYSDTMIKGFYRLAVSSNISEYSILDKFVYLGNPNSLARINKGEIVFSARGAQFGRVIIYPEIVDNVITNIDSLVIANQKASLHQSIFIAMFLNRLRWNKHIYKIAITGSGANSLTAYQSDDINFPYFPEAKQKEIASLYYNSKEYDTDGFTLENFLEKDIEFNSGAGIYELDKSAKQLKQILNKAIDDIVNDKEVKIEF